MTQNAVALGAPEEISVAVNTTVTISVPGFKDADNNATANSLITGEEGEQVWIKHEHTEGKKTKTTYYKATATYNNATKEYDVVFDNPDGFSTFTVFTMNSLKGAITGVVDSIDKVKVGMNAAAGTGKYVSGWLLTVTNGNETVASKSFTGSSFSQDAYNYVIEMYRSGYAINIAANYTDIPTDTKEDNNDSDSTYVAPSTDKTAAADEAVVAEEAQTTDKAAEESSANASGNTDGTSSKSSTKSSTKNHKVTSEDSDADAEAEAAEEEQVAEDEESAVEDVAQAEDNDLNANKADGGAIADTAANSSHAWLWLIVVLACACAVILIVVSKRRKDEKA
jgi:hypothetical protein